METRLLPRIFTLGLVLATALVLASLGGCSPDSVGRYNQLAFGDTKRVQNEILHSYDQWYSELHYWVQGEAGTTDEFPGPLPEDLKPPTGEYLLGPNDLLQVTIQDLFQQGFPYAQQARISENGTITLPYLETVKAAEFTTHGLEQRVGDMLKANGILRDPRVSIFVVEYRNRFYSVLAGVRNPGMYPLVRTDMDLLDALSVGGGVDQFTEPKAYIMRRISQEDFDSLLVRGWGETGEEGKESKETPAAPKAETPAEKPAAGAAAPAAPAVVPSTGLTPLEELQRLAEGKSLPNQPAATGPANVPPAAPEPLAPVAPSPTGSATVVPAKPAATAPAPEATAAGGWKFEDGRWVQVKPAAPEPGKAAATTGTGPTAAAVSSGEKPTKPGEKSGNKLTDLPAPLKELVRRYGIVQGGEGLKRVIRIDVPALLAMDPSQDIVLRNGDVINVPEPAPGEWYIDGEVTRRGPYSLTGRKITLLQAVCAAGGLTQLAVPQRTELVRRIDDRQEEIIYVDLAKIASGQAPDFFLQPDDLIRVGTDQGAIFLAVLRNAFRATYGFGMVYDENFADLYPFHGGVSPLFGGPKNFTGVP